LGGVAPVAPADGLLAVNLCERRSRLRLLATLARLLCGRFRGGEGVRHWTARAVEVELSRPTALEIDGEIVRARRASIDLLPERIAACG